MERLEQTYLLKIHNHSTVKLYYLLDWVPSSVLVLLTVTVGEHLYNSYIHVFRGVKDTMNELYLANKAAYYIVVIEA